jgi:hypothetical protein
VHEWSADQTPPLMQRAEKASYSIRLGVDIAARVP